MEQSLQGSAGSPSSSHPVQGFRSRWVRTACQGPGRGGRHPLSSLFDLDVRVLHDGLDFTPFYTGKTKTKPSGSLSCAIVI